MTNVYLSLFEHKTPTEIGELLSSDFNNFIKSKIKESIDELLEGEIEAMFNEAFRAQNQDFRNEYYYRHLKTHYGLIEVKVPRDRLNLFKTQIMKPYRQVTDDVDYVVILLALSSDSNFFLIILHVFFDKIILLYI